MRRPSSGFSLIWLISSIVIISFLGVGLSKLSSRTTINELQLNQDMRARYLAESGINYALLYKSYVANSSTKDLLDLNNKTIANLGTGEKIVLKVSQVGAQTNYNYNVTSRGTVSYGSGLESSYEISNFINAPADSGVAINATDKSKVYLYNDNQGNSTIQADLSALGYFVATVTFNPNKTATTKEPKFSGYYGPFGTGVRFYFKYKISNSATGDGFVFAIKNAANNTVDDVGRYGEYLGYAGPSNIAGSNALGIRPPKFGIEFDIYKNSGTNYCNHNGQNDPNNAHIGYVFWGEDSAPDNTSCSNSIPEMWDDVYHGAGGDNTAKDSDPRNAQSGNSGSFYEFSNRTSSTNNDLSIVGSEHNIRVDIIRSLTPETSKNTKGMYKYTLKTYFNCIEDSCKNLTSDYTPSGSNTNLIQLTKEFYLTSDLHTKFDNFMYGFTISTGAAMANYTFSLPDMKLR